MFLIIQLFSVTKSSLERTFEEEDEEAVLLKAEETRTSLNGIITLEHNVSTAFFVESLTMLESLLLLRINRLAILPPQNPRHDAR